MLRPWTLLPIVAVALSVVACKSSSKNARPADAPTSIAYGYQTGLATPAKVVARSEDEWKQVWTRHHSRTLPTPPMPEVDFAKEMVLGVALAQRPTGGYGVRITSVRREGEKLLVEAVESRPVEGAIVPQVLSQPYEF